MKNTIFHQGALLTVAILVFVSYGMPASHNNRVTVLEEEVRQLRLLLIDRKAVSQPESWTNEAAENFVSQLITADLVPARPQAKQKEYPVQHASQEQKLEREQRLVRLSDEDLEHVIAGMDMGTPAAIGAMGIPADGSGARTTEEAASRLTPRVERGGILLPRGRMQVEPTISYSHVSSDRVSLSGLSVFEVIFVGEILSEEIDRDIVTSSLNVRYGITNHLQAELELPAQFQREERLSGPIENREQHLDTRMGLSNIATGLYYQFAHDDGGVMPNMIASMRVKMPTASSTLGSAGWGVRSGLTMVKNSDPVVLFSNIGYTINFPAMVGSREVNMGNSMEYSAGLAYGLNYNLAINGAFEQVFVGQSSANGSPINGSRLVISSLKAGLTYAVKDNMSIDFSVGAGLTDDSPDLTVSFSVPYTF